MNSKINAVAAALSVFFFCISCVPAESPPAEVTESPAAKAPVFQSLTEALESSGDSDLRNTYKIAKEVRRGNEAPPPWSFRFPSEIPSGAKLRLVFGIADRDWRQSNTNMIFSAFVRGQDGVIKCVFRKSPIEKEVKRNPWMKREVSLAEYAGENVEIILQVVRRLKNPNLSPTPFEGIPVWAEVSVPARATPIKVNRPNFVWITIDTLRADHLACYGYERVTTPFIDDLANRGILFEQAIAQSPWTRPSVASMLDSAYPHQICTHNCFGDRFVVDPEMPSIQQILSDTGYHTIGVVNNVTLTHNYGCGRDFSIYYEVKRDREIYDYLLRGLREREKGSPFFAYLHLLGAHGPYEFVRGVTDHFIDREKAKPILMRFRGRHKLFNERRKSEEELQGIIDLYDGEILASDKFIERIVKKLESMQLMNNTVVVITSDHGEEFGEHGEWDHGHSLYDEIIRVPLILVLPKGEGGKRIQRQVALVDIAPTIADLARIQSPDTFVGDSLLNKNNSPSHPALSEHLLYGRDRRSVRTQDVKYIFAHVGRNQEIYDLENDSLEKKNLASRAPWRSKALEALSDFHRHSSRGNSDAVVALLFESKTQKNWIVNFKSDVSSVPIVEAVDDKAVRWKQSDDFKNGKLEFKTQRDKILTVIFPLREEMALLKMGISIQGQSLKNNQLIASGLERESALRVLDNLADLNIRRTLASSFAPERPKDIDASVRLWISAPETRMRSADTEELQRRLKTLGYLN